MPNRKAKMAAWCFLTPFSAIAISGVAYVFMVRTRHSDGMHVRAGCLATDRLKLGAVGFSLSMRFGRPASPYKHGHLPLLQQSKVKSK